MCRFVILIQSDVILFRRISSVCIFSQFIVFSSFFLLKRIDCKRFVAEYLVNYSIEIELVIVVNEKEMGVAFSTHL